MTPLAIKFRKKLEQLVWRYTHRDYRGVVDGIKTVLISRGGKGTCLESLSSLTDAELLDKLPVRGQLEYSQFLDVAIPEVVS